MGGLRGAVVDGGPALASVTGLERESVNVGHARVCVCGGGRIGKVGMTMIELIVVLAIIAIMSAVVVPTFARMGYFSRNDVQASARELFAMLKAAKIYAATYRVNTAIVYSLVSKDDSVTNKSVEAIDAAALVYKLPRSIADHTTFLDEPNCCNAPPQNGPDTHDDAFVPINMDETGAFFRSTKPDTAVLPDGNGAQPSDLRLSLSTIRIYRVEAAYNASGARQYDTDGEPKFNAEIICPISRFDDNCVGWRTAGGYPAHIFMASGKLLVPVQSAPPQCPERFRMYVGYSPDASPTERYADDATREFRVEAIELSQNTGRVQLVQE